MKPARRVVTTSPKRTVGLINCSWFQDRPIEHESRLEKHFVHRALLFPGLITIHHQPFKLILKGSGKHYTPDFLLTFANGERLVIEVKRSERIKALKIRLDEIAGLLREKQIPYFVVHQGQIEGQRRAERAGLLRRYAMLKTAPEITAQVVELVNQKTKGVSIAFLMRKFSLSELQVFHLIARRHITLGPGLLLSKDDLIFPVNKEIQNAAIQFGTWFGCAPWRAAA
nr:hypothetical protein [Rhodoferax sp.]